MGKGVARCDLRLQRSLAVAAGRKIGRGVTGDQLRGACHSPGKTVCGHSERDKKWPGSPFITKVGFPDGLNVGCEFAEGNVKRRVAHLSQLGTS